MIYDPTRHMLRNLAILACASFAAGIMACLLAIELWGPHV